jgi:hypothetical protein
MIEKEITQAKQCALTTRDWDTYQVIVRTCLTPDKSKLYQLVAGQQAGIQPPDMKNGILREKRG